MSDTEEPLEVSAQPRRADRTTRTVVAWIFVAVLGCALGGTTFLLRSEKQRAGALENEVVRLAGEVRELNRQVASLNDSATRRVKDRTRELQDMALEQARWVDRVVYALSQLEELKAEIDPKEEVYGRLLDPHASTEIIRVKGEAVYYSRRDLDRLRRDIERLNEDYRGLRKAYEGLIAADPRRKRSTDADSTP